MRIPSSLRSKIQFGRENRSWVKVARAGPGTSATASVVSRRAMNSLYRTCCERVVKARMRRFDERAEGITLTTHEATHGPAPESAPEPAPDSESPVAPKAAIGSTGLKFAGWLLHLYTAVGVVFGFLIVVAAFQGDIEQALWLSLIALIIDGTDGMTARYLRVSETIPSFDGARLDDIVDYLTYAFAPMVLLWTTGRLPDGWLGKLVAVLPLIASCYQFCRTDAKTADHFFLGFPSYWNVVAFYVFVLDLGSATTAVILLACTVLVFVPIRYVYPSRTKVLRGGEHRAHHGLARHVRDPAGADAGHQRRRRGAVLRLPRVLRGLVDLPLLGAPAAPGQATLEGRDRRRAGRLDR